MNPSLEDKNPLGVSFAICTYNGNQMLIQAIQSIRERVHTQFPYEIVVVNNNSTDETHHLIQEYIKKTKSTHIKYDVETHQGLVYARRKATQKAAYRYISFIDDDNFILSKEWVDRVIDIFENHPNVGIIGVKTIGEYEIPPPSWFYTIQQAYAVGEQYHTSGFTDSHNRNFVWGAGMSIRKILLENFFQDKKIDAFLLTGRHADKTTAGEDGLISLYVLHRGFQLFYAPELQLIHYIKKNRLTLAYARSLSKNIGYSQMILRYHPFNKHTPHKIKACIYSFIKLIQCILQRRLILMYYHIGQLKYFIKHFV